MPNANPQSPGTPSPDESSDASLTIPSAGGTSIIYTSPHSEYLQPPRLGIIHLLALMTVTAILMQIQTTVMAPLVRPKQQIPSQTWVLVFVYVTNFAISIVGTSVLLNAKLHRATGHFQPGHWIVIYSGLAYLLQTVLLGTIAICAVKYGLQMPTALNLLDISGIIVQGIVFLWFAFQIPERGRWKVFFIFTACIVLLQLPVLLISISYSPIMSRFFNPVLSLFFQHSPTVLLIAVAILDIHKGLRRDWIHWLGVISIILSSLNSIIVQLVNYFMR